MGAKRLGGSDSRTIATALVRPHGGRYTTRFYGGRDGALARLELDSIDPPYSTLKSEYQYAIVAATPTEFHLLGRLVPSKAIAYDPREVERWFRSEGECEAAKVRAEETLASKPQRAPFLGTHARRGVPLRRPEGMSLDRPMLRGFE